MTISGKTPPRRSVSPVQESVPGQGGLTTDITRQQAGQPIEPSPQATIDPALAALRRQKAQSPSGTSASPAPRGSSPSHDARLQLTADGRSSPLQPQDSFSDEPPRKRRRLNSSPSQGLTTSPASKTSGQDSPKEAATAEPGDPVDEARRQIEADLSFATLASTIEVGVPARTRAAISLIADGTVGPEFFEKHPTTNEKISLIENVLAAYANKRPDLSMF